QLISALRRLGLGVDRASLNAVRLLMSAGRPVTREGVGCLIRWQVTSPYVGRDQPSADGILAEILRTWGVPAASAHLEAVRQMLRRGLSMESLQRLAREQVPSGEEQEQQTSDSILGQILHAYDLPDDPPHISAAREFLARSLPLSREAIDRLARTLSRIGATEEEDFRAAVFLQANDLPVTESTIHLARSFLERPLQLAQQLRQLQMAVTEAAVALLATPQEDDLGPLLDRAAGQLSQRLLSAQAGDREAIVDTVRRLFADQGVSLENQLARVLAGGDPSQLEGDLRTLLGRLADMAMKAGAAASQHPDLQSALAQLSQSAPELADALQAQQLANAATPASQLDQWIVFQLPVSVGDRDGPRTAELRISKRPGRRIDPDHVRLLLRLDLPRLQMVEIGLQIVGPRVGCSLSSRNEETLPLLREQFGALRQGLEQLGYSVARPSFSLLSKEPPATEPAPVVPARLGRLDLRA
ncbi:MAG TPA: flagellar hook-length control protein FliK, partial [Chloroflexota bacterium]|nr:flagellar hook-length control protein FliK [Chloroflexota bacterium]